MANTVKGMCNYCGVGCSLQFVVGDDGSVVRVSGNPTYAVNRGKLCPKGFKIMDPINAEDRGLTPLVRQSDGTMKETGWDGALDRMCRSIKEIQNKYGKKSVAFISTGQLFTEECALLGLLRGIMGIDGDGNTRQCMASAVVGYKQAFGFDAPPLSYQDIEESDCVILIGSNTPVSHPIVWERYKNNKNDHDLVVIDPRKNPVTEKATLYLPVKPKRDLILLYTLANALIQSGKAIDRKFIAEHSTGFEQFRDFVKDFKRQDIEEKTGIDIESFDRLVKIFETRKKISFWWCLGVNQSHQGTRTIQAIINLTMMTGNIGRAGTGPNSLTGQTNAMGSRLYSNTTCLYGGRDYANPEHRKQVSAILGISDDMIPDSPSKPYDRIIDRVESGEVKALWIVCTNPLHSWINSNRINSLISKLDLFVVQDLYPDTVTAKRADIFLPAAGIGEKEGFLINSERRLGYSPAVKKAPGLALADYQIFQKIAEHWGVDSSVLAKWKTPENAFDLIKTMSVGMPCDISGIENRQFLMEHDGIQWPFPKGTPLGQNQRRLFEDGKFYTADGKAKFLFAEWTRPKQEPDNEYPLYLLTGRGSQVQFQTMTRTGRSKRLREVYPDRSYIEVNAHDAGLYDLTDDMEVRVVSRQGEHLARVKITDTVSKGYIFSPMHFLGTNNLVADDFDEFSREPSYKTGAVRLERV